MAAGARHLHQVPQESQASQVGVQVLCDRPQLGKGETWELFNRTWKPSGSSG